MSRSAFVTGGTGFLGINLIHKLLDQDWEVYALYRESSDLQHLQLPELNLVLGTVNDPESLGKAIPQNVDVVFHLAGNTAMWSRDNKQQYIDNVTGTENVISCALDKKAKRFVHTSSIGAYGIHHERIDESTPSNAEHGPINYNKTKYLGEMAVKAATKNGLNAVILNPAHIIGPYDAQNWAQLLLTVYRDELPGIPGGKGSFCHVNDIVDAHISAVEKGNLGENYLLGGEEATFIDVINMLQEKFGMEKSTKVTPNWVLKIGSIFFGLGALFIGKEPQITPEKFELVTGIICCNFEKAQRDLGYSHTPMKQSFSDSYDWLKKEGVI